MLRSRNVYNFQLTTLVFIYLLGAFKFNPRPTANFLWLVWPSRLPEGEKLLVIPTFGFLGNTDNQGFSVQCEPIFYKSARRLRSIKLIINCLHGFSGGGIRIKNNLRNGFTLLTNCGHSAHQCFSLLRIGNAI